MSENLSCVFCVADFFLARNNVTEALFIVGQAEATDFASLEQEFDDEEEEVEEGEEDEQGLEAMAVEEDEMDGGEDAAPMGEQERDEMMMRALGVDAVMHMMEERPVEFEDLPAPSRTSPLRLLCEKLHVKNGYVNIQAHGGCAFNDCSVSASAFGLKAESSFVGRLALQLNNVSFDRAPLLLSGGCDAVLSHVRLASGRISAVSNCVLCCENVAGTLVLLRRLNADKGVARVELRGDGNQLVMLEEPEVYPTIRKDECASVAEFCEAFMRESRRLNCCTRVFTGVNHLRQPLWECHSCPKHPVLCWHCVTEHQGLLHNTTTSPGSECGFCDCECFEIAK